MSQMWFQQDGATSHTAKATMELLGGISDKRLIPRNWNSPYSARSPDLIAQDCFLWGYLKERVNKVRNFNQLKEEIQQAIRFLND